MCVGFGWFWQIWGPSLCDFCGGFRTGFTCFTRCQLYSTCPAQAVVSPAWQIALLRSTWMCQKPWTWGSSSSVPPTTWLLGQRRARSGEATQSCRVHNYLNSGTGQDAIGLFMISSELNVLLRTGRTFSVRYPSLTQKPAASIRPSMAFAPWQGLDPRGRSRTCSNGALHTSRGDQDGSVALVPKRHHVEVRRIGFRG